MHKYSSGYSSCKYSSKYWTRIFPIGHFYSSFKYAEYVQSKLLKISQWRKKAHRRLRFYAMIDACKEETALADFLKKLFRSSIIIYIVFTRHFLRWCLIYYLGVYHWVDAAFSSYMYYLSRRMPSRATAINKNHKMI